MDDVIRVLHDSLPRLKAKYSLNALGIFGSYSRREQNAGSDLDIIYETLPGTFLTLHSFLDLQKDLNRITQLKVDLVNKKYMNEVVWLFAKNDIIMYSNKTNTVI